MRALPGIAILWALTACGPAPEHASNGHDQLDTSKVFIATPPTADPSASRTPSQDSVLATVAAYRGKRVSVDVAARIIVDYFAAGGHLDPRVTQNDMDLVRAIGRELDRRTMRP
jgi:hypothetical protein